MNLKNSLLVSEEAPKKDRKTKYVVIAALLALTAGTTYVYTKTGSDERKGYTGSVMMGGGEDYQRQTAQYGGNGGNAFDDADYSTLTAINIGAGNFIDGVQACTYSGCNALHGGTGGDKYQLNLEGRCIDRVTVKAGSYIDGLQFFFAEGDSSMWYGGKGGDTYEVNL